MSLRYFYRPSWRSLTEDPVVEFTDNVRLYTLDCTEKAEESDVGMFTLLVDDDQGTLDFPPLTRIWATESEIAASSNTLVFHGYIMDRTVHRGPSQLTSAARVWEVSVADENSIISRRVLSSPSANRPAETDVARAQWLANEADGQLLIDDTTFLSTASPVNMDAVDYRGQTGADVLNDCAQASGKNHWFYFKESVGSAIWYGAEDLTTHNSMIRLTNVLGDVDNSLTFAIGLEQTKLVRDPSRLLSGTYFQYAGGGVYVRNMAMFPEIGMRDLPFSSGNVKTLARATARANRYLANNDSEEDRITTTVRLPAAKVNWIRAGMRLQFRATHLPGYEDYVYLRVYERSVAHDSEDPLNTYLLTLTLGTNSIPPSPSVPGQPEASPLAADLTVGSAVFLGLGADREEHYSRDVGQGPVTLQTGKQYRLVASTTFNRTSINPDAKTNNGRASIVTAGGTTILSGVWTPASGTNTSILSYAGTVGPSWGFTNLGRDTMMDAGDTITGDWITYSGAGVSVDICIAGDALSGFHGFQWSAHLELQER